MSPTPGPTVIVDTGHLDDFVTPKALDAARQDATAALAALTAGTCAGSDTIGWRELPARMRAGELDEILTTVSELRDRHPVLVVIGIGGSSLGARATLDALGLAAEEARTGRDPHEVVFAGHHLSADTLARTLRSLEGVDYAVNVISKSGTTTEPGLAFRVFLEDLKQRWGSEWTERVVATTDAEKGALRAFADDHDLTTFVVPPDVGGRFSVLSPVGLLPLAFAGVDVTAMLDGAQTMASAALHGGPESPSVDLAGARHALYEAGFTVEVLAFTTPRLRHLAGWWQQLFGESEGKEGRGAFPAVLEIPADLHSLGQYMQDGHRQVQETMLHVAREESSRAIPEGDSRDGLDYLTGRPLSEVLEAARRGTIEAHRAGGVPVIEITAPAMTPATLGELVMLFEVTVALGGALLGVNPFDQPGVEAYKGNMFRELGRPGWTA